MRSSDYAVLACSAPHARALYMWLIQCDMSVYSMRVCTVRVCAVTHAMLYGPVHITHLVHICCATARRMCRVYHLRVCIAVSYTVMHKASMLASTMHDVVVERVCT